MAIVGKVERNPGRLQCRTDVELCLKGHGLECFLEVGNVLTIHDAAIADNGYRKYTVGVICGNQVENSSLVRNSSEVEDVISRDEC